MHFISGLVKKVNRSKPAWKFPKFQLHFRDRCTKKKWVQPIFIAQSPSFAVHLICSLRGLFYNQLFLPTMNVMNDDIISYFGSKSWPFLTEKDPKFLVVSYSSFWKWRIGKSHFAKLFVHRFPMILLHTPINLMIFESLSS